MTGIPADLTLGLTIGLFVLGIIHSQATYAAVFGKAPLEAVHHRDSGWNQATTKW